MAGFRFVQELTDLGTDAAITVIGDEPGGAYNRVLLSSVLAGAVAADSIELADYGWYAARGVKLQSGTAATAIDRDARVVRLADGSAVPYDVLVLATGSDAVLPPVPGLTVDGALIEGAVAFRTLADCAAITAAASAHGPAAPADRHAVPAVRRAVVLGGGVLGLETARGLAGRGLAVTVVQRGPRLMERQLDASASRVLTRTVRSVGIDVRAKTGIRSVRDTGRFSAGRLGGVELGDGTRITADLLVLCCGTRPRAALARDAGLAVNRGVVVDDQMRSVADPSVFAIGECAEHRGRTHGLVAPCWEQARVAARAIGTPSVPGGYTGSAEVLRLKAAGIELAALGSSRVPSGSEVITFADPARGVYQKLVVRDGRLTAAILLGDTRMAGTITQLFDRGASLPADRSSLLMVRRNAPATAVASPTALPGSATICQCNGVTKSAIYAAWQDGATSAAEVASRTRATTGCGTCKDAVEGIIDWLAAADPALRAHGLGNPLGALHRGPSTSALPSDVRSHRVIRRIVDAVLPELG
jgi:assimilatory nitrate reductase electron transfer subunit